MSNETLNISKDVEKIEKTKSWKPLDTNFLREHKILTEEKIQIIEHPAQRKYIIGGKGGGKTLPMILDMIIYHENNPLGSSFAGRQHKESAAEKMGGYFERALNLLKWSGYKTRYPYEKKRNRFYAMKDKKNTMKNSYQAYFSLEDKNSTDGAAPENLGFYGILGVDEPIVLEDMLRADKIPDAIEWENAIEIIRSNLNRYNTAFMQRYPNAPLIKTREWYAMNDWGKHPLSIYIDSVFPQSAFIKTITGYKLEELLGNRDLIKRLCKSRDEDDPDNILDSEWADMWRNKTTVSVYNKDLLDDKDDLIVRITKFANPDEQEPIRFIPSLIKLADGFINENWSKLAQIAGLQYRPRPDNELLVYNIDDFNNETLESMIDQGYLPTKLSYGVDIDSSRVFTITPAYEMIKENKSLNNTFKRNKVIFIDKQIELNAMGSGEFGELHEIQAKQIGLLIKKHFLKAISNKTVDMYLEKTYCIVDDNRKIYLKYIRDTLKSSGIIENFMGAVKQGHYEILERQDYFEESFKQKKLFNHIKNKSLEEDIRECVKPSANTPTRTTSGSINYLDRIDSAEYAVYPFITTMVQSKQRIIQKQMKKLGGPDDKWMI